VILLAPEFQTVFEMGWRTFPWRDIAGPFLVGITGVVIFKTAGQNGLRQGVGFLIALFGLGMCVLLAVTEIPEWHSARVDYLNGQTEAVEGTVEYFRPPPYVGPTRESFTVGKITFVYYPGSSTPCFTNAPLRRAPIRNGAVVRIHYIDGCIQRVDIQPGSGVASADAASDAETEKERQLRALQDNPQFVANSFAGLCIGLIVSLLVFVNWRRFVRFWIRRPPPYSRTVEVVTRLWSALTFAGCGYRIDKLNEAHKLNLEIVKRSAPLLFAGLVVFAIVDAIAQYRARNPGWPFGDKPEI
jgi:hypothetical protein